MSMAFYMFLYLLCNYFDGLLFCLQKNLAHIVYIYYVFGACDEKIQNWCGHMHQCSHMISTQ